MTNAVITGQSPTAKVQVAEKGLVQTVINYDAGIPIPVPQEGSYALSNTTTVHLNGKPVEGDTVFVGHTSNLSLIANRPTKVVYNRTRKGELKQMYVQAVGGELEVRVGGDRVDLVAGAFYGELEGKARLWDPALVMVSKISGEPKVFANLDDVRFKTEGTLTIRPESLTYAK